jgi:putative ABC transport system permease protein
MTALIHDFRSATRSITRSRGVAGIVIATLALGIGASTTIFSVVNAALIEPLRYPASDRLVTVSPLLGPSALPIATTPAGFLAWRARSDVFDGLMAYVLRPHTLNGSGEAAALLGASVTDGFTETLGVQPQLGRALDAGGLGSASGRALISAQLWKTRFSEDRDVVGRVLSIDDAPVTVVGVMPDGFSFPRDLQAANGARTFPEVDIWMPLAISSDEHNATLQVVGRLREGVSTEQARAALIAQSRASTTPRRRQLPIGVSSIRDRMVTPVRPLLLLLFAGVTLLQIIACVNVANLLLARASARAHDTAIRAALGSSRRRLAQQLLLESTTLALLGGAAGLLLAAAGVRIAGQLIPNGTLPHVAAIGIDARVLLFTIGLSLVSGIAAGLIPALQPWRTVVALPDQGSRTYTASTAAVRTFIVAEVALGFVLVVGAGIVIRSFDRLTSVDPGFEPDQVVTAAVSLPERRYPTTEALQGFATSALESVRALPAVQRAAVVDWLPIGGQLLTGDFAVDGFASARRSTRRRRSCRLATSAPSAFGWSADATSRMATRPAVLVSSSSARVSSVCSGRDRARWTSVSSSGSAGRKTSSGARWSASPATSSKRRWPMTRLRRSTSPCRRRRCRFSSAI